MSEPSDDELNALFAEKVAGWTDLAMFEGGELHGYCCNRVGYKRRVPDYLTDANAMLPWLEKEQNFDIKHRNSPTGGLYWVTIFQPIDEEFEATASTFARAAVLALLKAAGVEVRS